MECLKTSYLQILKKLDFGNRKVIFAYHALSGCYKQRENLLRCFWYMMNTFSSSEDVLKLGVVICVYNLGDFPANGMDYEKSRRVARLMKSIPVRVCAFYPCINTRAWEVVVDTFSLFIGMYLRFRLRVIKGDHESVLMKLKAIGIPSDALPVTDQSKLLSDDHLKWIEDQKIREDTEAEPPCKRSRAERKNKTDALLELVATASSL